MGEQQWFAVRTIVAITDNQPWGPSDLKSGEADYEERVTIWFAEGSDAAIALAEAECEDYVADVGGRVLGFSQTYTIGATLAQGVEVFSLIRRSALPPEEYLDRHFDTGGEHQGNHVPR